MNKRNIGSEKETIAAKFLEQSGYKVLDKNYWCIFSEIDIVAMDEKYICFVEVKYRKNHAYEAPVGVISNKKIGKIIKASQYYMMKNNISPDYPIRYDVIFIIGDEIKLIKNAFEC